MVYGYLWSFMVQKKALVDGVNLNQQTHITGVYKPIQHTYATSMVVIFAMFPGHMWWAAMNTSSTWDLWDLVTPGTTPGTSDDDTCDFS